MAKNKSRGHLSGGKYAASHGTVIPAAERVVRAIERMPEVKKIALSLIKQTKCTPGIKIIEENPGCLLATIRGNTTIQQVRVYLADPSAQEKVEQAMRSLVN